MTHRHYALALALSLAAGCGNQAQDGRANDSTTGSEEASSLAAQRVVTVDPRGGATGDACSLETVYFGFDSSELSSQARDAIESAVTCLRANQAQARLHVTGATDPEGTEEYNLALGERRAHAVQAYLTNLGVEPARVTTASVGEEMASGEDEAGWARDRHASTRVSE